MSDSFGLIKGLKVTFKELFRKSVTDKYPKEFRKKPQSFSLTYISCMDYQINPFFIEETNYFLNIFYIIVRIAYDTDKHFSCLSFF